LLSELIVFLVVLACPVLVAADVEEVVPFQVHRALKAILVNVEINGEHVKMLVDTGAARTIISSETLGWGPARLKAAEFSRQGPGMSGQATWEYAEVRLGETVWNNRPIVVMDFRTVHQVLGRRVGGILGQDILTEFASVEIDFRGRELRLRSGGR
jgi:predicted aspartyl protease